MKSLLKRGGCLISASDLFYLSILLFVGGSLLHFSRGYYYRDVPTFHSSGMDDAYISYRYGWNLAKFGTLSWNESGYRRTEGFTNPLWVYISALMSLSNDKDKVYPLMVVLSIISSLLLFSQLFKEIYAQYGQQSATIGMTLLAASPIVWLHMTSGLESTVFGFVIATIAYLSLYKRKRFPLSIFMLTIIAILIRSDGFIYIASIIFAMFITRYERSTFREVALGLLWGTVILLGWRMMTFQRILPNTAIAKLTHGLLERVPVGLMLFLFILFSSGLAILIILGILGSRKSGNFRAFIAFLLIIFLWVGYYIYMGGDLFLERHLLGIMIFAAAASAPFWLHLNSTKRLFFTVLVLLSLYMPLITQDKRFSYAQPKTNDAWIVLGKALQEDRGSYGVIVTFPAGKIPYFAGGDFIDSIGLNDVELAKYKNARFVPGHSSGSFNKAIEIASEHPSGRYSIFTFFDTSVVTEPDMVKLWVSNYSPQPVATHGVTNELWNEMVESQDYWGWSVISTIEP